MVTMAQSTTNWRNMHSHMDHTHSLTRVHQHSYNHVVRSASPAVTEFGIKFFLKVMTNSETLFRQTPPLFKTNCTPLSKLHVYPLKTNFTPVKTDFTPQRQTTPLFRQTPSLFRQNSTTLKTNSIYIIIIYIYNSKFKQSGKKTPVTKTPLRVLYWNIYHTTFEWSCSTISKKKMMLLFRLRQAWIPDVPCMTSWLDGQTLIMIWQTSILSTMWNSPLLLWHSDSQDPPNQTFIRWSACFHFCWTFNQLPLTQYQPTTYLNTN